MTRRGLTLVELVVAVAILAVLVGLLLPAAQKVRESAARAACCHHARQLVVACHGFADARGRLPSAGGWWHQAPVGPDSGWGHQIGPHLEESEVPWRCPTKPGPRLFVRWGTSSAATMCDYAGADLDGGGAFAPGRLGVPLSLLRNGTGQTLLAAEKRLNLAQAEVGRNYDDDFGRRCGLDWDSMRTTGRRPLPDYRGRVGGAAHPAGYSDDHGDSRFGGGHPGVFVAGFADGSVRPLTYDVDPAVWLAAGRR